MGHVGLCGGVEGVPGLAPGGGWGWGLPGALALTPALRRAGL